jgi:hypothetical protein
VGSCFTALRQGGPWSYLRSTGCHRQPGGLGDVDRRVDLAGSLGAALTTTFAERRWIATREASRIVTVTEVGQVGLRDWLGIDLAELRAAA